MSKIDELIKEYCPDGVEYKELGEIGYFYNGLTGKTKSDFINGNSKFINYKNILNNIEINFKELENVKIKENEKQNKVLKGDVIFTGSSESLDEVGMSSVMVKDYEEDLYLNSFSFGFRFNSDKFFDNRFLKYLFRSFEVRKQIKKASNGVTRINVSKKEMEKVKIPIPPLPVQEAIVERLDAFTTLQAELQAELLLRKKQYSYYQEKLLTFDDNNPLYKVNVKYKKICKIYQRLKGTPITATKMKEIEDENGDITIFAGGQTKVKTKKDKIENANILEVPSIIVQSRGLIDFVYCETPFTFKNEMWAYTSNNKVEVKYLYHYLKSKVDYFRKRATSMGAFPQISLQDTEEYKIPLPPLEVQERLVYVLDNFEKICNDFNIGLPKEIELRQKQYEYYRDKLLTFVSNPVNSNGTERNGTERNGTEQG